MRRVRTRSRVRVRLYEERNSLDASPTKQQHLAQPRLITQPFTCTTCHDQFPLLFFATADCRRAASKVGYSGRLICAERSA